MLNRESTCRCLICAMERNLTVQLAEPCREEHYRQFADSLSLLSVFPSASDLIAFLHASRSASDGTHPTDRILAALLQTIATTGDIAALRDLLLLAFIPMLHSAFRQVAARYPSLGTDDIAQHTVVSLLQILGYEEFYRRSSHVAFAISRILKRNVFEWAEREFRSPVRCQSPETLNDTPSIPDTSEPIERAVLLRHFLSRCFQRGILTSEDLELLVQFKLDATRDRKAGGPATEYSNASRQRMKRLLRKLRHVACTPRLRKENDDRKLLF